MFKNALKKFFAPFASCFGVMVSFAGTVAVPHFIVAAQTGFIASAGILISEFIANKFEFVKKHKAYITGIIIIMVVSLADAISHPARFDLEAILTGVVAAVINYVVDYFLGNED